MTNLKSLAVALLATAAFAVGPAHAEGKTFKIWWYEQPDSAMGIAWKAALDEFQKTHPDVTVQFELKTFDQIVKSGNMILNSSEAPDVLEYNKGNGVAGLAASQGLMAPLDDAAKQKGWDKILNDASTQLGRYDSKGIYGSGPLVGIADYGEFVSVFYNKKMFDDNGIKVPTTLEEFEAANDAFVKKGITPIAEAANDYPAQHLMYLFALSKADQIWVKNFQGLKAPLDSAPFLYAGQKLQEWVDKGYLSKDSTALKADDMAGLFKSGKAPMVVTGSWYSTAFGKLDFPTAKFLFPSKMAPASTGNIWIVPASAQNKDLAYDFIDITLSKENQALLGNSGGLPVAADPSQITDAVGKQDAQLFNQLVAQDGLGFYPDWPVPGFYDLMLKSTQAVIGKTITPEEFAKRIKDAYDEAQSSQ
ncbi:MAG TPA: extracellular solute-binding protein [Bauldia sp.]|nr:extracellular solute-binding protein [Bauldia sp.]